MGFPSVDLDTIGHGGNGCKAVPWTPLRVHRDQVCRACPLLDGRRANRVVSTGPRTVGDRDRTSAAYVAGQCIVGRPTGSSRRAPGTFAT